jgi:hypothetical protein
MSACALSAGNALATAAAHPQVLRKAWSFSASPGVLIGNHGARFAMSERTRSRLFPFWELVDEIFNSVLFLLIGHMGAQMLREGRAQDLRPGRRRHHDRNRARPRDRQRRCQVGCRWHERQT